jgi:thiamine biosynthesis/tRNA modification protein thiI
MKKIILIQYGELSTKKDNKNYFISTLYNNIVNKMKNMDVIVRKDMARMYIEFREEEFDKIKSIIDTIFGIRKYQVANVYETNIDSIKDGIIEVANSLNFNTFKVETIRSYKDFLYTSPELNNMLGGVILKNINNIKVDVHNPDVIFHVEVRKDNTYIFINSYLGIGGYPVGTQSKSLLMLSGGIDSPVAGYLAMKRGIKLDGVYFEAIPHTSLEAREKVIELSRKLLKYSNGMKLYVVNFTKIQEEIYKNCRGDYQITIMRRMMYRIMEYLCKRTRSYAIINGESIGQVASQTLTSMRVINSVTNMPVIRPVACLDKLEIIDISKKIDTYDISILPYEDCCTVFVPKHPVINPGINIAIEEENKFLYQELIEEAVKNVLIINISDKEEFSDIL